MRRTEWTLRMLHHAEGKENAFITLTYDENWLPKRANGDGFLLKSDLQKYFKRVRAKLYRKRKPDITYYACGEYGEETLRPHYHAIVFNIEDPEVLEESWPYGHSYVGDVTADSIRYVAQYIDKKLIGIADAFRFEVSPFQLASNGLGMDYLRDNYVQWLYDGSLKFKGRDYPINKYYREKIDKLWPDASIGYSYRLANDVLEKEAELFGSLSESFQGKTWNMLNDTERALVSELLVNKNRAIDQDLRHGLRIKQRQQGDKKI